MVLSLKPLSLLAFALLANPAHAQMQLLSGNFSDGGTLPTNQIYDGFGCTGANMSPDLAWSGAPDGTQSYIVTAYDPDANTGSGWWHWVIFNIPATETALAEGTSTSEGALPYGALQARSDFSEIGYGGACPPEGEAPHPYVFTVYAMPLAQLPIDAAASPAMVGFFAQNMALGSASLTATYGR